ncbi:type 2 lanthipeptide synthetase LanM family protein [Lysobacter yananisis]|uniref:Type 2 lanthipeptide synthetase LanM family protein n=1 Tax=Lysobacter yananisis TaxID=1003114 RepID=A0ABY9PAC1_9GAMM|nr:type 2 lanthipeptide synthetase LanM family protein [Lysobacter yananisis]WMT04025.1 type 2 lanthipeptide synthetase LanM family protein [Lysobacter yananisis]
MASVADARGFEASLGCLTSSALDDLAAQLRSSPGLGEREAERVLQATGESLTTVVHAKVGRLLLLELNAARVTGRLGEDGSAQERWQRFIELASQREFWDGLHPHYPTLLPRVRRIVEHRCAASLSFARRWSEDRSRLAELCAGEPGELQSLRFGAGDSHCQGLTVAVVACEGGQVVYKPRSLAIDIALRGFLRTLEHAHGAALPIAVPRVVDRGGHGWSEFVAHRHAAGEDELRSFYLGIGHWLAVMRLLGGTDLHAENLIAHGGRPVVVDCETLFTPRLPTLASGLGDGHDRAVDLVSGTVLNIGLLPTRGAGLGWRGVDNSAAGMLPGQQPMMSLPGIVDAGSDRARLGQQLVAAPVAQNHPSAEPVLHRYWPQVLQGFDASTSTLQRMDADGTLRATLAAFADCQVRVVPRASEAYAEIGRMLWHPVSLHDEAKARRTAHELLAKMAANVSIAPDDPHVIDAEIDDLLDGDIPLFSTRVGEGRLHGPRGTRWLAPGDLAEQSWRRWKAADFEMERRFIGASLISAYANDGWMPDMPQLRVEPRVEDLDRRRREQAARIVGRMIDNAIFGDDGTVAWVAPGFTAAGWAVQPLGVDVYNGVSGMALLAGAYLREVAAGRADRLDGVEPLFAASVRTLAFAETRRAEQRRGRLKLRPRTPGAYVGLGSQIWTWLQLARWGLDDGDGLARARALAEELPESAAADEVNDVLMGTAGAIAPLLMLARASGDAGYADLASDLGRRLVERGRREDGRLFWTHERWPQGLGGFAHGASGMGWALTRLARETGRGEHHDAAQAAFAFEDALFDTQEGNWRDLRMLPGVTASTAWCHGATGIGLARADLDRRYLQPRTRETLRAAAAATWRAGLGWNHCACHGDAGNGELLAHAIDAGVGPEGVSKTDLLAALVTGLERHGAYSGGPREVFSPALLPGIGGIAYQLLRAHADSDLPTILVPAVD